MVLPALAGQYRAAFAMLRQCIRDCPADLWAAGKHPRTTWRIAYHTLFYTHLYLMPTLADFVPWERHEQQAVVLWDGDESGNPPHETTYTQGDLLEYLDFIEGNLDAWLAAIDLDAPESGFHWYPIPKLDHQLLNLRHLGGHVGQLSERLMTLGDVGEVDWVSKR